MKAAIIGAGLSGLSCAREFECRGIYPDIYERKAFIRHNVDISALVINMYNTAWKNPLKYLQKEYNLYLQPHYTLKVINMVGPTKHATINGELGCIFRCGHERGSMELQIADLICSRIKFDTEADLSELKELYDYVILATGDTKITGSLAMFTETFNAYVRLATVHGSFKTDSVTIWFNTEYAKHGYGYIIDDSAEEAKLVLIVDFPATRTDSQNHSEFEECWEKFLSMNNLNYDIVDLADMQHRIGVLDSNVDGNVYYIGLAGGFIDSFLGFGGIESILSGVSAARCICEGKDFNEFIKGLKDNIKNKHELRIAYNSIDNHSIDKIIDVINFPGIEELVYENPFFKASMGTPFVKVFNYIKAKQKVK